LLIRQADFTGRADDAKSLSEIVKKIDESEKTEVKSVQYATVFREIWLWALLAMAVLADGNVGELHDIQKGSISRYARK